MLTSPTRLCRQWRWPGRACRRNCRLFDGNTAERNSGTRTHQPRLLAGMLFDRDDNRMTPSYAVKQGARYRY
jgi:hypothetical protein